MAVKKRSKTSYPGVFYIIAKAVRTGKPEKIYYIRYRKNGKLIEEKAGRQFRDGMTPAKASRLRALRIEDKRASNGENRQNSKREKWTINRLWAEYRESRPNLKGIRTDENRFQNHIAPCFGDTEPKDIPALEVDRMRVSLLKTKSPGTVKNILELLRRIVNYGVKKNLCQGLSFVIEMPKVNNGKTEDLTPGQLSRLLEAIDADSNIWAANIMKTALYTGMRRGEMFKLKWEHIDFERGFIHLKDPKGGPDQKIPLNAETRKVFESLPRTESEYVFPGRNGKRRVDIKNQVNRIKKRAGLPKDFRALHGLRHVFASMMASSGKVDMYTLQKLLTHKSPQMTQRYAHLRDDALRDASNLVGEMVHGCRKDSETGESRDLTGIKNEIFEKALIVQPEAKRQALVSCRELRAELGITDRSFDSAVMELAHEQRIFLHKHIHPYRLTEKDKRELVTDGKGNFFVGIVIR